MSANIHGSMVYSKDIPMWHGLGTVGTDDMTAVDVVEKHFMGGFRVGLKQAGWLNDDGTFTTSENFKIVRLPSKSDPEEVEFGDCTSRFLPLQPMDVARKFDENVKQPIETIGFLNKGKEMFGSWKMPGFTIGASDTY